MFIFGKKFSTLRWIRTWATGNIFLVLPKASFLLKLTDYMVEDSILDHHPVFTFDNSFIFIQKRESDLADSILIEIVNLPSKKILDAFYLNFTLIKWLITKITDRMKFKFVLNNFNMWLFAVMVALFSKEKFWTFKNTQNSLTTKLMIIGYL